MNRQCNTKLFTCKYISHTSLYSITACVAQLAKASDTQAVGREYEPRPDL